MFEIDYEVPPTFREDGRQVLTWGGVIESALAAMIEIIERRYAVVGWRRID